MKINLAVGWVILILVAAVVLGFLISYATERMKENRKEEITETKEVAEKISPEIIELVNKKEAELKMKVA